LSRDNIKTGSKKLQIKLKRKEKELPLYNVICVLENNKRLLLQGQNKHFVVHKR